MSISTNEEIEGSLLRGAADTDSEASPKFLKDLSDDIADIRLFVDRCYKREIKMFESRLMFVRSMIHVMTKTNAHLAIYLKHLKLNKCIEPFCISSGQFRKDKFWKQIDSICQELQNEEEGRLLKENGDKLQALLAEVETVMHDCDPIVFKKFFFRKKLDYSEGGIVKKFKQTLYENRPITMEKLRGMQAKAVMKVLEKKVFKYASQPIQQEVDMVIPELTTGFQPFGFNLTDSFIEAYAIFRRFAEKKGPMYIINYETYGQYISDNFYKFSKTQRRAIFELDIMLELIHQEMVNRDGKLAQYLTEAPQQAHYAIVKELQGGTPSSANEQPLVLKAPTIVEDRHRQSAASALMSNPDVKQDVETIPAEKLHALIMHIVQEQVALPVEDILRATARALGYSRRGQRVDAAVMRAVATLITRGKLVREGETIRVKSEQ